MFFFDCVLSFGAILETGTLAELALLSVDPQVKFENSRNDKKLPTIDSLNERKELTLHLLNLITKQILSQLHPQGRKICSVHIVTILTIFHLDREYLLLNDM